MSQSPEARRKWCRETRKRRRAEWMAVNGPCRKCGGTDRLQVDHIDPSTKVASDVWLWGKTRREAELAKCQVLCTPCHAEKTRPNQQAAAKKRIGVTPERYVHAEIVQLICAQCSEPFTKKAARERFATKNRIEGPFCNAVCRGIACAKRGWKKRNESQETKKLHAKIIKLGRRGLPIVQIRQIVGSRHELIKRLLLSDGQQIRRQGIH